MKKKLGGLAAFTCTVVVSKYEWDRVKQGKVLLMDLLSAKFNEAEMSMWDLMKEHLDDNLS